MKESMSLGLVVASLGALVVVACGPSQPANTGDDGQAGATATATASADPGAGAAPAGGGAADGAAAGGGAAGGEGGGAAGGGTPVPTTPAAMVAAGDTAAGEKLFDQEHCNGCHGTKVKPPAKFPNLFKVKWSDEKIDKAFALIKAGKSPMPAYGDKLNDKQIADIVAFLKK